MRPGVERCLKREEQEAQGIRNLASGPLGLFFEVEEFFELLFEAL